MTPPTASGYHLRGDIASMSGSYSVDGVAFSLKTHQPVDPRSDANWLWNGVDPTGIAWSLDTNLDGTGDYSVLYGAPEGSLVAAVFRDSDDVQMCSASPSYTDDTNFASFPASCIGTPGSFNIAAVMLYDTPSDFQTDIVTNIGYCCRVDRDQPIAQASSGYWMISAAGDVYNFGTLALGGQTTSAVDIESTPSGGGYWILNDKGEVFTKGDAQYMGGAGLQAGERAASLRPRRATATGSSRTRAASCRSGVLPSRAT